MNSIDTEYSTRVGALFAHLEHGGLPENSTRYLSGQAGSRAQGASVRLWLQVEHGQVLTARFEAYGCPYFLAAAESLCSWLEDRCRSELDQWSWRVAESNLAAPAEKRARLLILEDALRSAAAAWDELSRRQMSQHSG